MNGTAEGDLRDDADAFEEAATADFTARYGVTPL